MPIRNYFLLLALIFSYHLFGQNTVSIFILDSDNKVDSAWVANRYTQVGFTPSISISEINTRLNTSNFVVVFVPSAFTPNGDQENELFIPIFNISSIEYDFSIYTIWDQRIFNSTDPKLGWNGKYNNKLVQNGIYSYKLLFNRKSITGTFNLVGEK